jgi:hypothetical protein
MCQDYVRYPGKTMQVQCHTIEKMVVIRAVEEFPTFIHPHQSAGTSPNS